MGLHHVLVLFTDGSLLSTFVEAEQDEMEKIVDRLSFYKDHGAAKFWEISRPEKQHDFESLKRAVDSRIDPSKTREKTRDENWPYDWPRPDV